MSHDEENLSVDLLHGLWRCPIADPENPETRQKWERGNASKLSFRILVTSTLAHQICNLCLNFVVILYWLKNSRTWFCREAPRVVWAFGRDPAAASLQTFLLLDPVVSAIFLLLIRDRTLIRHHICNVCYRQVTKQNKLITRDDGSFRCRIICTDTLHCANLFICTSTILGTNKPILQLGNHI